MQYTTTKFEYIIQIYVWRDPVVWYLEEKSQKQIDRLVLK